MSALIENISNYVPNSNFTAAFLDASIKSFAILALAGGGEQTAGSPGHISLADCIGFAMRIDAFLLLSGDGVTLNVSKYLPRRGLEISDRVAWQLLRRS